MNPPPAVIPHHGLARNSLLAAMPADALKRLSPHLEALSLETDQVLHESGVELHHLYFPATAIVTLLCQTPGDATAEIAMVGHEGVVGVPVFMGGGKSTSHAVVRSGGLVFRLNAAHAVAEFTVNNAVLHLLLRYAQSLITQMAQTTVCNSHHLLEQRLSRWLLMNLDRQEGLALTVTHETIAELLGVRREGVTEAVSALRQRGLVSSQRGHLTVLDREGLQARACECYVMVKRETDRLLPPPPPARRSSPGA
ncbi:MAG: Crp/Fnr family transcriptional regulator [Polaromonas sp.]